MVSRTAAALLLAGAALVVAPHSAQAATSYACGTRTGGSTHANGRVTDVRVGRHTTFDRFVIQFRGARAPHYTLTPKSSAVFHLDPSGKRVKLLGHAGLKLVLSPASAHNGHTGSRDLRPRFPTLREARQLGDFEGYVSWGLGLSRASCTHVTVLHSPTRLVVDVRH